MPSSNVQTPVFISAWSKAKIFIINTSFLFWNMVEFKLEEHLHTPFWGLFKHVDVIVGASRKSSSSAAGRKEDPMEIDFETFCMIIGLIASVMSILASAKTLSQPQA